MAFVSIESDNPKFSYIIQKNPDNVVAKSVREGGAIGWYSSPDKYCVVFKDPPSKMSYNKASFEYLDVTALNSPAAYLNLLSTFFSSILKSPHLEDSTDYSNKLMLGFIKCSSANLYTFNKFYEGILYTELSKGSYQVWFTKGTIKEIVHLANLFCIFMVVSNDNNYLHIDESIITKYLNCLKETKCPYYIANLFKVKFLHHKGLYSKFINQLQDICSEEVIFEYGNTQEARKKWIESYLVNNNNIVDLGAGSTFSYAYLSRNINGVYYPIDKAKSARDAISKKIFNKKLDKVAEPLSTWEDVVDLLTDSTEVIISEVLEHNSLEEAKSLLTSVLTHPQVIRVLVTLPYQPFNQFYLLDNFRHDNHLWETTPAILQELTMLGIQEGLQVTEFNIGDQVNAIPSTKGLLFSKQ